MTALDPSPFTLGVASADPFHTSVVLWTRLAPAPPPDVAVRVHWELARDEAFTDVVGRGEATARPASAHAVHVTANDLTPDYWYFYRFKADGVTSRIGRTRTLPAPGAMPRRLRFAFASYPAYRDLAELDLDFVLHLGDHASRTTSPDARAAHARFPFITSRDRETAPDYRRFDWGRLARFSLPDARACREQRSLAHWNVALRRDLADACHPESECYVVCEVTPQRWESTLRIVRPVSGRGR